MCSVEEKSKTQTMQLLANSSVSDWPLDLLFESLTFSQQDQACSVWYCHKLGNMFFIGISWKKPLKH